MTRTILISFTLMAALAAPVSAQVTKYVRYESAGHVSYGLLEGETVRELAGDLFASPKPSGRSLKLADVTLLAPCDPKKVIAVGLNYKSHSGERPAAA